VVRVWAEMAVTAPPVLSGQVIAGPVSTNHLQILREWADDREPLGGDVPEKPVAS
jgi:hypothetical protein